MTMADLIASNLYYSYNISTYNTDSMWGFVIAPIEADSSDDAIETANGILSSMSSSGSPQDGDKKGEIVCLYNTGQQNILAAAVNAERMISPNKLKQYIHKAR